MRLRNKEAETQAEESLKNRIKQDKIPKIRYA